MNSDPTGGRRTTVTLAGLMAIAGALLVLAFSGAHESHAESAHVHDDAASAATTHKQAAFQSAMRKLWEDHITWTRLAIISLAHDLPDLQATQDRLLRNQVDIGNAVKPYYDAQRGRRPARRQVHRRRPRLRRDPPPHPADGGHPQHRNHQAVPAALPLSNPRPESPATA